MALFPESCSSSVTVYHVTGGDLMLPYEHNLANAIIKALLHGKPSLQAAFGEQEASFDLKRMKQVNGITKEEEDIVIRVPWNPKIIASVLMKSDEALRRKVLGMVLGELTQEDHLKKIIKHRLINDRLHGGLEFVSFRSNPYLKPEKPVYDNFLNSLDKAAQLHIKGLENLLDYKKTSRRLQDNREKSYDLLLLNFHGTNQVWMDKFLEMGMDTSLRTGDADWFSNFPSYSIWYTIFKTRKGVMVINEGAKLLVFLLIKCKANKQILEGCIAVSSTASQLPIGEVTLRCALK